MPFTDAQWIFIIIFTVNFSLIIDRAHKTYNPYDTYNAWKGNSHSFNRLLLSWSLLYILPLLNFAIFYIILSIHNISIQPSLIGALKIVLIGLLSFFDFGYYRIFEAILYLSPNTFYTEKEQDEILVKDKGEFKAHFIPGILYVIGTAIIFLIIILY
jgi:hypothetical protein